MFSALRIEQRHVTPATQRPKDWVNSKRYSMTTAIDKPADLVSINSERLENYNYFAEQIDVTSPVIRAKALLLEKGIYFQSDTQAQMLVLSECLLHLAEQIQYLDKLVA